MSTRQCPTKQHWRGGEEAGTGTIVGYAKTKQALINKKKILKGTFFLTKPKTTTTYLLEAFVAELIISL